MNAVNTVEVLPNGSLRGSNTDGQGFVRSLEEVFREPVERKKSIDNRCRWCGAGNCYALHKAGYGPITFTNRTVKKLSN